MRPDRSTGIVALGLLVTACSPAEPEHEKYVAARMVLGGVAARTGDDLCPEEPACSQALAELAALGGESPDRAEAVRLIARVEAARRRGPLTTPAPEAVAVPEEKLPSEELFSAAAALAPGSGELPVPRPEPAGRKEKSRRRESWDEDDDWSISVVGGAEPGSGRNDEPYREREPPAQQPRAGPPAVSCSTLRAEIEAREIRIRNLLNKGYRRRQPKEQELDDLERGDGTTPGNFDDDPVVARLKAQLPTCKEP